MPRGRPRAFDIDEALNRALKVFWRKGYEGASMPELTRAMRINRPSLYAAFGNKEALFRKAVDRYIQGPACQVGEALQEPTARAVVEQLLRRTIELTTGPRNPRGCFIVQGALACGVAAEPIRAEMAKRRAGVEAAIRARFERAVAEGDLPAGADAADLARYIMIVVHGMAVQAAGGVGREELMRAADVVLRGWAAVVRGPGGAPTRRRL